MSLLRRNITKSAEDNPTPGTRYEGGAYCYSEGFFYPVKNDSNSQEIGPDFSTPLSWRDGGLVFASKDEPNHYHTYHNRDRSPLELVMGDE